ncbi:MAG TPA: TIGR03560 family F420-dependent LLM class oxidoreductase [Acidimicrobiales bacterium]|nr:TIGR03560 family F420-dependent LLM class oxidoreductase [Acidimicrobiales bacterium]
MRFSLWLDAGRPWSELLAAARHAEATGWDGVWIADHFMANSPDPGPMLEAGSLAGALAAAVDRVRIGTLVYGNTYRHPAVVANMAATVDQVSGGRFVLGVGAGWQVNEHEQYGIPLPPVGERVERFAEAVEVMRRLLDQPSTSFAGNHYRLTGARCDPKPVQQPLPILVGASGDRMLGITARFADEWNCWGLPDRIAERAAVLDRACEKAGRDPDDIARSAQALVFFTDDAAEADRLAQSLPRPVMAGTPERLRDVLAAYAEAGLDEFIVPDFTFGSGAAEIAALDRFSEDVAAAFR